jgi:hypothetical protein
MTRNEEILKQFSTRPMPMKDILKAMDISNKEFMIGFCDWLDMNKYEFETKPSNELVQLYLNQLTNLK